MLAASGWLCVGWGATAPTGCVEARWVEVMGGGRGAAMFLTLHSMCAANALQSMHVTWPSAVRCTTDLSLVVLGQSCFVADVDHVGSSWLGLLLCGYSWSTLTLL